jgi:hypothetical protein
MALTKRLLRRVGSKLNLSVLLSLRVKSLYYYCGSMCAGDQWCVVVVGGLFLL